MRILITGSSSFIGFHLVKFLSKNHKIYWTTSKKIKNYTGIRMAPNKFMPQDHELE